MTIKAIWDNNEKTIVRYIFEAGWTWEEFFAAKKQANEMMDTVSHKLGVILHLPTENAVPPDVLANARSGLLSRHANTVMIIFVSTQPFVSTMIETLVTLSPLADTGLATTLTLDEARVLIYERLRELANGPAAAQNPL
jgi:hypothetical protein